MVARGWRNFLLSPSRLYKHYGALNLNCFGLRDKGRQADLVDTGTASVAAFAVSIFVAANALLPILLPKMVPESELELAMGLVPWAALTFSALLVMNAQNSALDGLGGSFQRAKIMVLCYLLLIISGIILIPFFQIYGLVYSQLLQQAACIVMTRLALRSHVENSNAVPVLWSSREFLEIVRFGSRLQFASIPQIVYEPLTRVLVNHYAGLSYLALFDLAYKVCSYSRLLIEAALTPLVPELAVRSKDNVDSGLGLYERAKVLSRWAAFFICLAILLIAPVISIVMLNEISEQFICNLRVFAVAFLALSLGVMPKLFARATGRLRWNITSEWSIATLTLSFVVISGTWLHPNWISAGAAVGIAIGGAIGIWGNARMVRQIRSQATQAESKAV